MLEIRTFIAMATFVGLCDTRFTTPYVPLPRSSNNCNWSMLMVYDEPLEKSTPDAWRTAFPLKLSAPEGSLMSRDEYGP